MCRDKSGAVVISSGPNRPFRFVGSLFPLWGALQLDVPAFGYPFEGDTFYIVCSEEGGICLALREGLGRVFMCFS